MKKKYIICSLLGISLAVSAIGITFIHPHKIIGFAGEPESQSFQIIFNKDQNYWDWMKYDTFCDTTGAAGATTEEGHGIIFQLCDFARESKCWAKMKGGYFGTVDPIHGMKSMVFEFPEGETPNLIVAWGFEELGNDETKYTNSVSIKDGVTSTNFDNSLPSHFHIKNMGDVIKIASLTITYDCVDHMPPATE